MDIVVDITLVKMVRGMGTHAYIRFISKYNKSPWVYVHYDGYPEGIATKLDIMFSLSNSVKLDVDYLVASFIAINKLTHMVLVPQYIENIDEDEILEELYYGYGVSQEKDIIYDYEYIIDINSKQIIVRNYNNNIVFQGSIEEFINTYVDKEYVEDVVSKLRRLVQLIKTNL